MNKLLALLALLVAFSGPVVWSGTATAEWNAGCGTPPPAIEVIGAPASGNSGAAVAMNLTFNATCPSGSTNVVAVACVATHRPASIAVQLDVPTWSGTPMNVVQHSSDGVTDGSFARIFILRNPQCDDVPHAFSINAISNALYMTGHIMFLKNVDQGSTIVGVATNKGSAGTPTITVASASGRMVVDCVAARNSNTNLVVSAGQTLASKNETTNGGTPSANEEGGQSYKTGDTSVTMSWTGTSSVSWANLAGSMLPATVLLRHLK